jgi:hypothetical protein
MSNPLALLGLLAVVVPILIHLLGRQQSRVERFPTLRFIGTSRLNPTARRRISDWPLLLIRIAIIASAAIALTQPVAWPRSALTTEVSRAVIVDTSASMYRVTAAGPASLRARQVADSLANGVASSRIETDSPADALDGAIAWLETRPGLREIAIISDFQRSSIDTANLAAIPASIGIVIPSETRDLHLSDVQIPRFTRDDNSIATYAGPSDVAGADAAWRAVGRQRPPEGDARIAIIYRGHPAADSLLRSTTPIDSAWMGGIVAAIERDATFASVGAKALQAGRNGPRLNLFLRADAGSLASAALNQALLRAISTATPGSEQDTSAWAPDEIARWQRKGQPAAGTGQPVSDGRLFWALALVLIGVERLVRSRARAADVTALPTTQERAA